MSHFESNFCLSPCRAGSAGPLIVALGHCMPTLKKYHLASFRDCETVSSS